MFYYEYKNKILISNTKRIDYTELSEEQALNTKSEMFYIINKDPRTHRRCFPAVDIQPFICYQEGAYLLKNNKISNNTIPPWLIDKIQQNKVFILNMNYPNWTDALKYKLPKKAKVNIIGMGDVGGTTALGLKLLGSEYISHIGLYDIDTSKSIRFEKELNQIIDYTFSDNYPNIKVISKDIIFDCDILLICVTAGIPQIAHSNMDIRMAQFSNNLPIIGSYAKAARSANFKGIFAILSDPVDYLCKAAFDISNTDTKGHMDFCGLAPEQVLGLGLGVMFARAFYISKSCSIDKTFSMEGRVFGPHGNGLVVANSIKNYDHNLSLYLTEKTQNANIEIRKTGFKPYIAPALSSGSLTIIEMLKGNWIYSSLFLGGRFMGLRNKLTNHGLLFETYDFPEILFGRIENTFERLGLIYESYISSNLREYISPS